MIGILDSGMGGLTTLAALIAHGADHAFCYYADTAHAPYGNRGKVAVTDLVLSAVQVLCRHGATRVVLACNTASVAALRHVQSRVPVAVYGVTPPVAEARTLGGETLLLGTRLTTRTYPDGDRFRARALPSLATLIDAHYPHLDPIERYCRQALSDVGKVDNLILGCTHYALIGDLLGAITGARRILDGTDALLAEMGGGTEGRGISVDILSSGTLDARRYAAVLRALTANPS
jgi:glutamate racemase